ncbi:hypothetical protein GCM10027516_20620 [Niabella aquatica]
MEVKVAPLLFLPFVKNAFKYVSHDDDKLNFVRISLVQKDNVRRRLDLLYQGKYNIFLNNENEKWHVVLNVSI